MKNKLTDWYVVLLDLTLENGECGGLGQNVRIVNTNTETQCHLTSKRILEKHERDKKRQYNNRITVVLVQN